MLHTHTPLWKQGRHPTLGEVFAAPRTPGLLERDPSLTWGGRSFEDFIRVLCNADICVTEDAEALIRSPHFTWAPEERSIRHSALVSGVVHRTHDIVLAYALFMKEHASLSDFIRVPAPCILDEDDISRTFLVTGDGPTIHLEPAVGN